MNIGIDSIDLQDSVLPFGTVSKRFMNVKGLKEDYNWKNDYFQHIIAELNFEIEPEGLKHERKQYSIINLISRAGGIRNILDITITFIVGVFSKETWFTKVVGYMDDPDDDDDDYHYEYIQTYPFIFKLTLLNKCGFCFKRCINDPKF